ncbi:hypothetical protein ZWY2020_033256 [Hordeum vulgare]|nr:hypothetical protein ZWY2020_033256 [Hordeum vulgare]
MPLSRRNSLMCELNGDLNHSQCFYNVRLEEEDIFEIVKKLSGKPVEHCSKIGLKPFCVSNPAPEDDDFESQDEDVEESLTRANSIVAGLKQSLAEQQDAQAKFEEKLCLALADMEKMKEEHKELENKANIEQAALLKREE